MPLERQVARVDFTGGLETKQDERLVVPGKLLSVSNASLEEAGTLRRRDGLTGAVGTSPATHRGLGLFSAELLTQVGSSLYSFSDAGDTFSLRGPLPDVQIARKSLLASGGWQDCFDWATISGYRCIVFRENDPYTATYSIRIAVLDDSTGSVVLSPTTMSATGFRPRVVAVTGAFIAFYGDAGNLLRARVIQTSAPTTLGAETSIRTDLATGTAPPIDACADGANAFVVYTSNDATYSLRAIRVTRSGTTPSVAAGPANIHAVASVVDTDIRAVAIATYTSTLIGVFYLVDNSVAAGLRGLWSAVITDAMAISVATARQDLAAAPISADAGDPHIVACLNGATMRVYSDFYNSNGRGTATTSIRVIVIDSTNVVTVAGAQFAPGATRVDGVNGPFIAGKPLTLNSVTFLPTQTRSMGTASLQNSWFLLNQSAVVVGKALQRTLGRPYATVGAFSNEELACSSLALSASQASVLAPEIRLLSFASGTNVSLSQMASVEWTVLTATPSVRAELGANTFFAGGALTAYDGLSATEAGFHQFPETPSAATGGAGSVTVGDHQIVVLYEWIDGAGQRHQSEPSVAFTYTAPGGALATITAPTLMLSQKVTIPTTNVNVVAFATVAGGATFFRINAVNAPVLSATNIVSVTITYNISDATLQTQELLYTTGGILPNNSPPPCTMCMVHQGRLFIDSETVGEFRYSQPSVPGFGLQWNESLNGRLTYPNEALAGMVSIDDKALFFSAERPYVLVGRGPATTGAQNGYELFEVTADVGCIEPRSLVRFPGGVLFKSRKGWYVMDRGLNARYIGSGVAQYDTQNVTSAVLCGDKHEIRITSSTTNSVMLVYNYDEGPEGEWATYSTSLATDAVWWTTTERYVWTDTTTGVKTETPGVRTDSGTGIPVSWKTAWLHLPEAIAGFQRVWRAIFTGAKVGTQASQVDITAEFDLKDGTVAPVTLTVPDSTVLYKNNSDDTWELRWHLPVQKCSAIRFLWTETPTGNSEGLLGITSLTLEVGVKKGARKFRAGQSF